MVKQIPMICEKCLFLGDSVSFILAHKPLPIILFSFRVFFSKEFMSTTPFVANFTIKQQGREFFQKCSGFSS